MKNYLEQYNEGAAAYKHGAYEKALELFNEAMNAPDCPESFRYCVHDAKALTLKSLDDVARAVGEYEQAVNGAMMYGTTEERQLIMSNYLMTLHYIDGVSDEKMRDEHFRAQEIYKDVVPFSFDARDKARRRQKKKIRVGYISPDVADHIAMHFAVQLFASYSRDRFEVVLYETGSRKDEVTDWLESMVNARRDVSSMSADDAARRIRDDDIDILFDLAGHTDGGATMAIMARHPASVTICGIGYFDTTGLSACDYFLGDVYCDGTWADALFREKIIRLPHSHFCYTPPESVLSVTRERTAHDYVTFGSFNNFLKITDEMLIAWREILSRVDGSRLLLKNTWRGDDHVACMTARLKRLGFDMARVDVRQGTWKYMDEYMDIDIALDTYPYTGGGTTCEALYMGVPVVTRYGMRHGSRFGYSLLENVGLDELAAPTLDEYVERAVMLASDRELIAMLHGALRGMMQRSPLMDVKGYIGEVEAAYEKIWADWLCEI